MSTVLQTGTAAALVGLVLLLVMAAMVYSSVVVVSAYEKRALTVFGEFRTVLEPGLNFVPPFVSQTYAYDMRTQEFEVSADTATGEGTTTAVATIQCEIDDVEQVFQEVEDYRAAVGTRAEKALKRVLGDRTTESVEAETAAIETEVREALEPAVDGLGIRIESVSISEADA